MLSKPSVGHPAPCSSKVTAESVKLNLWSRERCRGEQKSPRSSSSMYIQLCPARLERSCRRGGLLSRSCLWSQRHQDKQTASSSSEPERSPLYYTEYQRIVPGQEKLVPQVPTVRYKRKVFLSPTNRVTFEFL